MTAAQFMARGASFALMMQRRDGSERIIPLFSQASAPYIQTTRSSSAYDISADRSKYFVYRTAQQNPPASPPSVSKNGIWFAIRHKSRRILRLGPHISSPSWGLWARGNGNSKSSCIVPATATQEVISVLQPTRNFVCNSL